jgi:hypothetical protein
LSTNLGEVANEMAAFMIINCQHIEEEWLYVVVKRLVVEEQLSEKAQILTVDLIHVSVHFKY